MLRKLASQTALYGFSSVMTRLINYLLVILHTDAFATESYGIVAYYYALAALLNVVYTHGMETTYFRFSSRKDYNPQKVYGASLTSVVLVSVLLSVPMIVFSEGLANGLGYPEHQSYVQWFAMILAIDAIIAIPFAKLRHENKAFQFVGIKLAMVIANVLLNIFFLYFCRGVYEGEFLVEWKEMVQWIYDPEIGAGYPFLCNLLANALAIPFLWRSFSQWRPVFSRKFLKPLWKYAYPLALGGLAYSVNEVLDRLLLEEWLPDGFYLGQSNLDALGVYNACYKLSIFITIAVQGFKYAAEPFFFSQAKDKNSPMLFAQVMRYFVLTCLLMMVFVSANLGLLGEIFLQRPSYRTGLGIVPILLLANIFLGIYYNLAVWFKITDRTHFGAWISGGGAVITLTLNFLLIPILGYHGSAIATLCCYFSMSLACFLLGKRFFPIPYQWLHAVIHIVMASAISLVSVYGFENSLSWSTILLKNGLALAFLLWIAWGERARLVAVLQHFYSSQRSKSEQ